MLTFLVKVVMLRPGLRTLVVMNLILLNYGKVCVVLRLCDIVWIPKFPLSKVSIRRWLIKLSVLAISMPNV